MKLTRDMIAQVREMLERNWDIVEIAHRAGLDPNDVQMIVEMIRNVLT